MHFLDILAVFRLDLGQISFNLAENALATRPLAFLATGIAFYDISTRACAEIKIDLCQEPITLPMYIHTYIHKLYLSSDFSVAYIASISDPNLLIKSYNIII